jgi:dihydropteroate synthase
MTWHAVSVSTQGAAAPVPQPVPPAGLPDALATVDRCLVMGIVNVTPDSFSDGGLFGSSAEAVAHGVALAAAGADLVDVGGESTRPGAQRVEAAEELARVLPVVSGLVARGVPVSIDTMRAATAEAAVAAGAVLINDVSGGLADPDMVTCVAQTGRPYVIMHWRAHSQHMNEWAGYGPDVVGDVVAELGTRVNSALAAGIPADRIVIDPGLGFAKEARHNWALLAGFDRLLQLGFPVLIGASRKRFLGELLATSLGPRPVGEREAATAAVSALMAAAGAWGVRVHDVRATSDAVRVVQALRRGWH